MVCPYCHTTTSVINSRHQKRLNAVWRRRSCNNCGTVFTTHESIELSATLAVQKDERSLVPFERDLLFISVYEACKHREQAIQDATALTQTIIGQFMAHGATNALLTPREIASSVHATLARFDDTAARVYAAYHLKA